MIPTKAQKRAQLVQILTITQTQMLGNLDGDLNWRNNMTINEVNILGQILNTTFGKSSSPSGTYSIKCDLAGNNLNVKYSTIVHFAGERSLPMQVVRLQDESAQMINSCMKEIKAQFKEMSGRSLKATDIGGGDNIELVQTNARNPRKTAYYRFIRNFEIE